MAISFRISSFDFRLFDFLRKDENKSNLPENEVKPTIDFDPDQTSMTFDVLNGSMMLNGLKKSYEDLENEPVDITKDKLIETESPDLENDLVDTDSKPGRRHNNNLDEVTRTIRYKMRQQFKEYKREYSVNYQYNISRADTQIDEIYLNKHLRDTNQNQFEENRNIEKQKDNLEKTEQIKGEQLKQDLIK